MLGCLFALLASYVLFASLALLYWHACSLACLLLLCFACVVYYVFACVFEVLFARGGDWNCDVGVAFTFDVAFVVACLFLLLLLDCLHVAIHL